jgi:hypothetical protein
LLIVVTVLNYSAYRYKIKPSKLQTRIKWNNQFLESQSVDIRATALMTINQGLISGAHTPKGSKKKVGAGIISQRLRKNPNILKTRGNNHPKRNIGSKFN